MKYYIATSTERMAAHNWVRDGLKNMGHVITTDWTLHGSVRNTSLDRLRDVAHEMARGVIEADFVIVLLPGGKGTHTELGLSLASQKRLFIHSEDPKVFELGPQACAFYHHAEVTRLVCPLSELACEIESLLKITQKCS